MRKQIGLCLLLTVLAAGAQSVVAKDPPRDVLGVRPGMSEDEARRRLNKIGRRQEGERMKHEVWEVSDRRISHVGVRFDAKNHVVRWVTAIARADARPRLRYDDVADLGSAQHKTDGINHTYIWTVPAQGKRARYVVEALGSDPQYLTSYRLLRAF
jgi:hypothetical protein